MIYSKFSKRQLMAMLWWQQKRYKDRDAIIADGSIRSGKTVSMTDGFVLWSMTCFNHQAFAICGKTIESLRRNVVLPLRDWLPGDFTIVEKRNENRLIISTPDGRENSYHLFGGRDESSYMLIQGMTLAGVMFDEVALMPRSFVEQACARCSVPGSKYWFNCNPSSPEHWFYKEWVKKHKEKNALRLHFTMDDNLALDASIKARYESMYSGVFYQRYIKGLWVLAEGVIYQAFTTESMDIKAQYVKPYTVTTIDSDFSNELENILNEQFNPEEPNAVWCSDITYIWTLKGFVYLICIMDLYARKIIAWTLSRTLETSSVIETIDKAKAIRKIDKPLVFHSNRGIQFVSKAFIEATGDMQRSYSKKAYPWDNACIESFHALIKREWLNRFKIRDYDHAYMLVFEYIEAFYNTVRIHSHCGYMSPDQYEKEYMKTLEDRLSKVS